MKKIPILLTALIALMLMGATLDQPYIYQFPNAIDTVYIIHGILGATGSTDTVVGIPTDDEMLDSFTLDDTVELFTDSNQYVRIEYKYNGIDEWYSWQDPYNFLAAQGEAGSLDSSKVYQATAQAMNDSGLTGGCGGSGPYSVLWYAYDSSNAVFVSGIKVHAYTYAGGTRANGTTQSGGGFTFNAEDTDTLIIYAYGHNAYNFPTPDTVIITENTIDSSYGYSSINMIPPSADPDLCTVFLTYSRNSAAQPGAILKVENPELATDTVNDIVIGAFSKHDITDQYGQASLFVPKSYIYHDSLLSLYDITLKYGGQVIHTWEDFYVPDQDTVRLTVE